MAGIFKVNEVLDFVGSAFEPIWLLPILVAVVVAIVAALRYAFKTSIYPGAKEAKSNKGSIEGSMKKRKRTRIEEKPLGDALKNNTNTKASSKTKSTRKVLTTEQRPSTSKPVVMVEATKKESIKKESTKKESTAIINVKGNTKVANNKKVMNDKKTQLAAATAKGASGKKMANTKEVKSAAKNMEKPLDHTGNDGGEWQTVITKKQKKTIIDLLAQAEAKVVVNEGAAKSADKMSTNVKDVDVSTMLDTTKNSHESSHSNNNNNNNNNNNKEAKEQANKTKKASYDQQKQQETNIDAAPSTTTFTVDNKLYEEQQLIGTASTLTMAVIDVNIDAADRDVNASDITTTITANVPADPVVAKVPIIVDAPIESSIVFDELGDSIWTEAKAPRKSKKRAHRE